MTLPEEQNEIRFRGRNFAWCARQDLNLRPSAPQADVLSTELRAPRRYTPRRKLI